MGLINGVKSFKMTIYLKGDKGSQRIFKCYERVLLGIASALPNPNETERVARAVYPPLKCLFAPRRQAGRPQGIGATIPLYQ